MLRIEMVKIGPAGEQLSPESEDHVAVFFPQFGVTLSRRPVNSKEKPQTKLEAECKKFSAAGHSDWEMPEIDELSLIIDRSRHAPAIHPWFDVPVAWLWSKTPAAWSSSAAWLVYAYYGVVSNHRRSLSGFALAVRRAGQ